MSISSEKIRQRITLNRSAYNEQSLNENYSFKNEKSSQTIEQKIKNYFIKKCKPSRTCALNYLFEKFPFIKWITKYSFKFDFLKDLTAGLTVGVIQIAPTMANSTMANLPPINGLYVAFFSVMVYFFMGSCMHLSLGTHGVVSLMIGKTIEKYAGVLYENKPALGQDNNTSNVNETNGYLSSNSDEAKIMIATSLALLTGMIHILLSICNGGVFTKYLSKNVLNSFTISSSIIIVVSQINTLLGVPIKDEDIPFELVDNFIGIFKQIHKTNIGTLIISIISILVLYSVKRFINEKFKKKLVTPIPIELIVVIIATLLSYFLKFEQKYGIKVVGNIPLGMPSPRFPPIVKVFVVLIGDAFNIAIVSFALNISLVKYFSDKHDYEMKANQELLTYGFGNLACSFFGGFPACSGLTRSLIVEGIGARTQVYSLVSSLIVLATFVGVGFLFKALPNACLASIIVVSLIHKCFEAKSVISIFKKSKLEALAWCATFSGVIVLDIDYGLYIGLGCSLLLIIFQTQRPPVAILGILQNTEFYENIRYCNDATEIDMIRIIRYESNIYYANVENFIYQVIKLSKINLRNLISLIEDKNEKADKLIKRIKIKKVKDLKKKKSNEREVELNKEEPDEEEIIKKNLKIEIDEALKNLTVKDIVLDLSCVNFIDSMGAESIVKLNLMFKKVNVQLHLTHLKKNILHRMDKYSFNDKFDHQFLYPTNHDAVCFIQNELDFKSNEMDKKLLAEDIVIQTCI